MSWDQDYSVEGSLSFLEKLANVTVSQLLLNELQSQGYVIEIKKVTLADDDFSGELRGDEITVIKDGVQKVYVPRIVKQFTSGGNYGCDYYEYREENEKVNVVYENKN